MTLSRFLADAFEQSPFGSLVAHFLKRIISSDDEEDAGEVSLGLGAVLAILASPGAFASIFLLDKYSTLLQWLRGQHFDPYKASVADEYFFVVLSMTVTGLVMVLRWNRLFPDRRDFSNLAVLPIPVRNIFLANFLALLGLAFVFAVDVNAVSAFLFPLFVTMAGNSMAAFLRIGASNLLTVLAASLFSFFGVFALVGVLMAVLPRRLFRPVSLFIRMLLVVGLLTEFFSNLFLQLLAGRLPHEQMAYARLLPSFWFLGVYESIAGLAGPAMARLGREALFGLLATVAISIAAYTLCYRRHFLRLTESFDVVASPRHRFRFPLPNWLAKLFFRSEFELGCAAFLTKVLFRSERHLMFFGGYLGIGLVMVAQTFADSGLESTQGLIPDSDLLAVPVMIAFFVITGLRFVFDMPATLNANWLFRLSTQPEEFSPGLLVRKVMLFSVLSWELFVIMPITAHGYGWRIALLHTAAVVAVTLLMIEVVLAGFRKIPFTCSTRPDIKRLMFRLLAAITTVTTVVPVFARLECWMLPQASRFIILAVLLSIAYLLLRRYTRGLPPEQTVLTFEDCPRPAFEFLKLA